METTNPIAGSQVSSSQWGGAVYRDLSALSNIAASGLMSIPTYTHNTNTAYNDIPSLSMNFVKQLATSKLLIFGSVSLFITGTSGFGTTLGVRVDGGTIFDAGYLYHNSTSFHSTMFFGVPILGLAAGTRTITWAEKSTLTDAARQVKFDTNDRCNCIVIEIP